MRVWDGVRMGEWWGFTVVVVEAAVGSAEVALMAEARARRASFIFLVGGLVLVFLVGGLV
jgi:hypothetical protein